MGMANPSLKSCLLIQNVYINSLESCSGYNDVKDRLNGIFGNNRDRYTENSQHLINKEFH